MMNKNTDHLDLNKLIKNFGNKKEGEKGIVLLNELDFVVRKNQATAAMAIGILRALADLYQRHAMNTTTLLPKEEAKPTV